MSIKHHNINSNNFIKKWVCLPPVEGKIYADMITDLLKQKSIPNYTKMDWAHSAYLINGANIPGQTIKVFVPEKEFERALSIVSSILGNHK